MEKRFLVTYTKKIALFKTDVDSFFGETPFIIFKGEEYKGEGPFRYRLRTSFCWNDTKKVSMGLGSNQESNDDNLKQVRNGSHRDGSVWSCQKFCNLQLFVSWKDTPASVKLQPIWWFYKSISSSDKLYHWVNHSLTYSIHMGKKREQPSSELDDAFARIFTIALLELCRNRTLTKNT